MQLMGPNVADFIFPWREQNKSLLIIIQLWPHYGWHKSKQYKDAKIFTNEHNEV